MRILWLSASSGLLNSRDGNRYNGGGWISSLQRIVEQENAMLALAYPSRTHRQQETLQGTTYYPIYMPPLSPLQKLKYYYGGYKNKNMAKCVDQLLSAIKDFQPDIIHLFGTESPFACILGKTDKPVVVHLQGLLSPYCNAFYPPGINQYSFLFPFTHREWILRNGYIYAHKNISHRGKAEHQSFKEIQYCMGRTLWDKQVSRLLSPNSMYFQVNEILREGFYQHAGDWNPKQGKTILCSTISDTVYKGLDLILKTAALLKQETDIDFEWQVIGISDKDPIVRFFEKELHISSQDVNVRYVGVLQEKKLVQTLLLASFYVHPSYIDNSPNSLCEAQLLGLPVIATYVGGIPSLVTEGETGFLVPANAPFELSARIKSLCHSTELQEHISQQATETAQRRHNKREIYQNLILTYKTIVEKHHR